MATRPPLLEAEAAWTRSLLGELTGGTMPGIADWRRWHETGGAPPGWAELMAEVGADAEDNPDK